MRRQRWGRRKLYSKPYVSNRVLVTIPTLVLLIMMLALVCPGGCNKTNAADEAFTASVSTAATAQIPSMLSVSLSDSATMTIAPSWNGSFTSSDTALSVSTNNPTGYRIFLETADGSQDLNPVSNDNTQKIGPIIGKASKNNFTTNINKWGYALLQGETNDNTEYIAVPATGSEAVVSTNAMTSTSGTNYNLSFAAIVSATLPVDTYTNNVIVTVLANPIVASVNMMNIDYDEKPGSDTVPAANTANEEEENE